MEPLNLALCGTVQWQELSATRRGHADIAGCTGRMTEQPEGQESEGHAWTPWRIVFAT